jgi:hypothetical protein
VFEESGLQRYDTAVSQAVSNVSVKLAGNGGSRVLRSIVQSPMRKLVSLLRRRGSRK